MNIYKKDYHISYYYNYKRGHQIRVLLYKELNLNTLTYYIFDKKFKLWMNSENIKNKT